MKKVFTLVFIISSLLLKAQNTQADSAHFNYQNPQVGDYIRLAILSDWCSPNIRPDAAKELDDNAITILKRYPNYLFRLEVHNDCRSDSLYNRQFTQDRADTLLAYILSKKGIDSSQITALGVGEDDLLIVKCKCGLSDYQNICTEREHQLNRRTLLRVVGRKE